MSIAKIEQKTLENIQKKGTLIVMQAGKRNAAEGMERGNYNLILALSTTKVTFSLSIGNTRRDQ